MGTEGGTSREDGKALAQKRYCSEDGSYYLNWRAAWNCGVSLIHKDMGIQKLSSN